MPVIVNGVEISDDEVHAEMQHHPASSIEDARHKAAEALVIRQLLLQQAQENNLLAPPLSDCSIDREEQAIDALLHMEISVPEADDETCARYYQHNQERFLDKSTDQILPLESVISYIRDYLHARSLQAGIGQYIKLLIGKAHIAGLELEGSDSSLVQ